MIKNIFLTLMLASTIVVAAPAQPTNASTSTIQLAWNPVTLVDTNTPTYTLYQGINSGNYYTNFNTTNTVLSVSNLVRGTTYYFVVSTVDVLAGLTSPFSNEVSYSVVGIPVAPSGLRIIVITP